MNRPSFPIAAWDVPAKDMDKWKARGINVLVGCGLEVTDTPAARLAWAAEAARRDLWVVYDTQGAAPPPNLYAFLLPDEMDAKQADPAVPKWNGLTPEQIKPKYDAFKALSPTIPVFMSLSGDHITVPNRLAYYRSIAPYCEIWSEDWYWASTDPIHYTSALKAQAVGVLKQADPTKPVWSWVETAWQNLKNRPAGRQITQAEFAQTCSVVRAAGIAGRGYFSHVFNGNGGWVAFDGTPDDIAAEIIAQNQVDNPPVPAPPIETKDQEQDRRLKSLEAWAKSFGV